MARRDWKRREETWYLVEDHGIGFHEFVFEEGKAVFGQGKEISIIQTKSRRLTTKKRTEKKEKGMPHRGLEPVASWFHPLNTIQNEVVDTSGFMRYPILNESEV